MPSLLRPLAIATGSTAVVVFLGVTVVERPDVSAAGSVETTATPSSRPTSLTDLATDDLVVRRASFCRAVPASAVTTALAGSLASAEVYGDGDRIPLPGGEDVVAEDGCRWTAPGGSQAAAWVFAPPVTVATADSLVSSLRTTTGCTAPSAPAYGSPSVALVCADGQVRTASFRGLFGDAWLTCTLTPAAADPDLLQHAAQWCAAVAVAAG